MKRYIFLIFIGVVLILIATTQTWYAYQPRVGPVGNGPNDVVIWTNFTWKVLTGLLIIIVGIIGLYIIKNNALNTKGSQQTDSQKIQLRTARIILLVLLSFFDIGFLIFTIVHGRLLNTEPSSLGMFVIMFFLLTSVIVFGFFRTFDSIKKGNL
jgi:magnesium-transporting ATPase (P-type)